VGTLEEFVKEVDSVVMVIFHQTGEILPMWHTVHANGEIKILPNPSVISKSLVSKIMRKWFAINEVVRYVYVNEEWSVMAKTEDVSSVKDHCETQSLEFHPDRVEILMYSAEDDSGQVTASRQIIREDGKLPALGELEITRASVSEGRFVGMLAPRASAMQ